MSNVGNKWKLLNIAKVIKFDESWKFDGGVTTKKTEYKYYTTRVTTTTAATTTYCIWIQVFVGLLKKRINSI